MPMELLWLKSLLLNSFMDKLLKYSGLLALKKKLGACLRLAGSVIPIWCNKGLDYLDGELLFILFFILFDDEKNKKLLSNFYLIN